MKLAAPVRHGRTLARLARPALRDVHLLVNVLHSDVLVSPGSRWLLALEGAINIGSRTPNYVEGIRSIGDQRAFRDWDG
jgi:hypothetical protein